MAVLDTGLAGYVQGVGNARLIGWQYWIGGWQYSTRGWQYWDGGWQYWDRGWQ